MSHVPKLAVDLEGNIPAKAAARDHLLPPVYSFDGFRRYHTRVDADDLGTDMTEVFDLSQSIAHLRRDGTFQIEPGRPGPPKRVDGYSVGAPSMTANAPHRGEMHPDGDELLFLVSGRIDVVLETDGQQDAVGQEQTLELLPGNAIVVPKGVWHRVLIREPSQLVHITPGPGGGVRLLER